MKNKKKVAIKAPKRNLLTLLIAIGGLAVAFFVAVVISSYASLETYDITPFQGEEVSYNLENAEYINGDEFTDFGFDFTCEKFDINNKAVFKIKTYKLEEQEIDVQNITINVCLTTDSKYVNFCEYRENTKHKVDDSSNNTQTYNLETISFPTSIDAFPFDIKVKEPVVYVYLHYQVKVSTETGSRMKTSTYVLKYTYSDFMTKDTIGGIER
jgi:hypothetical protein